VATSVSNNYTQQNYNATDSSGRLLPGIAGSIPTGSIDVCCDCRVLYRSLWIPRTGVSYFVGVNECAQAQK
jgi:hypothetical protein